MTGAARRLGDGLAVAGLLVLMLVALPLLAVLLWTVRAALVVGGLAALAGGLLVYATSVRFRDWTLRVLEGGMAYKGVRLANGVELARGHAWARRHGGEATVGVDDLAQRLIGPVEAAQLPTVGIDVRRGEPLFRLTHGERALAVASPLSGRVVAVNDALRTLPQRVNHDPFRAGWAVQILSDDLGAQARDLFRGRRAREWFKDEVDRALTLLAAPSPAPATAADGGVIAHLHELVDDAGWARLQDSLFTAAERRADDASSPRGGLS